MRKKSRRANSRFSPAQCRMPPRCTLNPQQRATDYFLLIAVGHLFHSIFPWPDQKQDQQSRETKQNEPNPQDSHITLSPVVNRAGEHGTGEASPHIKETHRSSDRREMTPAEKISHGCPNDGERGIQQSEQDGEKPKLPIANVPQERWN